MCLTTTVGVMGGWKQGVPTYTPRAVMFDLKGSSGAMPLQHGTSPALLSPSLAGRA